MPADGTCRVCGADWVIPYFDRNGAFSRYMETRSDGLLDWHHCQPGGRKEYVADPDARPRVEDYVPETPKRKWAPRPIHRVHTDSRELVNVPRASSLAEDLGIS